MISQTAEYALRAMVCLADEPGRPLTGREIAERTQVPLGYLAKVMKQLGRSELVRARRGLGGGFALARPAAEVTILEVIGAVDPIPRIRTCPLGLSEHGTNLCPLHRRIDDAMAEMERAFGGTFLSELLSANGQSKPLCDGVAALRDLATGQGGTDQ